MSRDLPNTRDVSEMLIDPRSVRLLVLDPDAGRRTALADELIALGYGAVVNAADPSGGATACAGRAPDLVLLAVDAPSGPTPAAVRAVLSTANPLPIIGLTSDASPEARAHAARLDVQDVALRPLDGDELKLRIGNALATGRLRRLLGDRSTRLTEALRGRSAELDTVRESLSVLAAMADYHDDDTDHHADRVGILAAAIAQALGLPEASVALLRSAAPLHDIGKVGTSRRILLKPGKLSPSEWLHMQHHVDVGSQILSNAHAPVLVLAAEIARTHHERYDGSGYTAGLRGDEIPLSGRIVAVADVWDTLTHDRPYRPAWDEAKARDEIHASSGSHFDPAVVEAFASLDLGSLQGLDAPTRRAA